MTRLPKAILFDLDDTILSAYARPEAAWLSIAEEFVEQLAPLSVVEVVDKIIACSREFWSDPARHRHWRLRLLEARRENVAAAFAELGASGRPVPPTDVAHALGDRFSEYREEQMHLLPDAHEVVDALKQRGVLLALVTNGAGDTQRAKVERFELAHRFDHIQIEGECGFRKPEERAYLHAMEALEVKPDETWMVGDNLEMGGRGSAATRHLRDLARRARARTASGNDDSPGPHHSFAFRAPGIDGQLPNQNTRNLEMGLGAACDTPAVGTSRHPA